jgi:hypothetical protein
MKVKRFVLYIRFYIATAWLKNFDRVGFKYYYFSTNKQMGRKKLRFCIAKPLGKLTLLYNKVNIHCSLAGLNCLLLQPCRMTGL